MKSKNKSIITPIRKATEAERTEIAKWTIGISHFPEMDGKARAFFPTHSFEILRDHEESVYNIIVLESARDQAIKGLKTTEEYFKYFRQSWLNGELKKIDRISIIPSLTRNDLIQLEMYRDYINGELKKSAGKKKGTSNDLSNAAVALIAVHEGNIITRDKGGVYNHFIFYSKKKNRINVAISRRMIDNKIELFEKVIPYLSSSKKQTIIDEIDILKTALKNRPF